MGNQPVDSLLTRELFRAAVFERDSDRCVHCGAPGLDAHHIMERRLWPDGGYYLNNGVTVCGPCHLAAERTILTCDALRHAAQIPICLLPPHLYPDEQYDKWGNILLPTGRRIKGELFEDESVQKVLEPVLHLFDNRVKYPRTWHLPWSAGITDDDRVLDGTFDFGGPVVVTEKMDGENTTLYRDYMHARSLDYSSHVTRNWMKAKHAAICGDIPEDFRICGENLSFKHSLGYTQLSSFFMVFGIWQGTTCLSWAATVEWCALLGLEHVPVLYEGSWDGLIRNGTTAAHWRLMAQAGGPGPGIVGPEPTRDVEGYVIRPAASFKLAEFATRVGKFVRASHVTTHGHWMRSQFIPNKLK